MTLPPLYGEWSGSSDLRDKNHAQQIRLGSHHAFEALFRTYYPRLCRFAFRLTGSRSTAEELVQDIFVRLWKNRTAWTPLGSVRTYLYRAVRNQAINYQKHQNLTGSDDVDLEKVLSELPGPEEELYEKELQKAVGEAVELLPPRCRAIFLLHRVEGLTYAEIAQVLDLSTKTVETQMGRALKTLRRLLVHYLPTLSILAVSVQSPF
ncbi:MAG: RNA polymerase sigma-70 factor [Ignavibacteriales bacterium]|nr:RNA polymerase sigma-70 factor [Ignavibacteriales bacterium]